MPLDRLFTPTSLLIKALHPFAAAPPPAHLSNFRSHCALRFARGIKSTADFLWLTPEPSSTSRRTRHDSIIKKSPLINPVWLTSGGRRRVLTRPRWRAGSPAAPPRLQISASARKSTTCLVKRGLDKATSYNLGFSLYQSRFIRRGFFVWEVSFFPDNVLLLYAGNCTLYSLYWEEKTRFLFKTKKSC